MTKCQTKYNNIVAHTKATINLSAQSLKLCTVNFPEIVSPDRFLLELFARKDITDTECFVIELLYRYGLRISEVLNIKPDDIKSNGLIQVKTEKGGLYRLVNVIESRNYLMHNLLYQLPLSNIYTRFYFYRLFKKLGFTKKYGNNINSSVTHYFRHELVKKLEKENVDKSTISSFLAHRSEKSIKSYEK